MGLEDPKDLRARSRKFLNLTNERKKMSKTTLRKRISLVAVSALTAGVLSAVVAPAANANIYNSSNADATVSKLNVALVGAAGNLTGAAVVTANSAVTGSKSHALLYKDASSTTAQTATVLAGGTLVLYTLSHADTATSVGFTATGGSFGTTVYDHNSAAAATGEWSADKRTMAVLTGTAIAVTWAAGTTAGTYTINSYLSTASAPSIEGVTTATNGTLFGGITVTVVAAAATAGPVVANSTCSVATAATNTPSSLDASDAFMNGYSAYVNLALKDAYLATNGTEGNIVVTATNGAVVNIGTGSVAAGTASTVVAYGKGTSGDDNSIRVSQGTAGAPVTTTVTITFNGSTICTKTITIRGVPASMAIASVSSVAPGGNAATAAWLADGTNRDAHMYIQLKDSAGNTVLPGSSNDGTNGHLEFAIDSASITNLISSVDVASADQATSVSSSLLPWNYTAATYTCGSSQYGTQKVTVKHTSAATGKVITGTFDARCAGAAYTYTASFDKASYVQGEVATLTVKFLDSKGNAANSVTSPSSTGTTVLSVPMMTRVSSLPGATTLTKADGSLALTYTVSLDTAGVTAGAYNGIIDFPALTAVAATKQTVGYKVTTGADTTTNADVLKSIVALIASINKQIQALQKLILKR
jgi:hypothetical protein